MGKSDFAILYFSPSNELLPFICIPVFLILEERAAWSRR